MMGERETIQDILRNWYTANKRDLPWRNSQDPYRIWLSEVILQQTRVNQGYDYYLRFVEAYPNVESLAKASEEEILKLWQGLGYYSRARNLHASAKRILSDFAGKFPSNYNDIRSLKGVGDYTAAAIASFAFNLPYAAVDGNVYRVLSRLYGLETPIDTSAGKREFDEFASKLLSQDDPATHNQAMMEFGSLQCVPSSPNCGDCPLANYCVAYKLEMVKDLPVKRGKIKPRNRYFHFFDIRSDNKMILQKRTDSKDIWQGLYQLPLIETSTPMSLEALMETESYVQLLAQDLQIATYLHGEIRHVLSHQILYVKFYELRVSHLELALSNWQIIDVEDLDSYPISRLLEIYFENRIAIK